jgi:hypothetical protein
MSDSGGYGFTERPMCDARGCENVSSFHGFGRDVCWSCYARLMTNGGFYRLTGQIHHVTMPDYAEDLTGKKKCGRVGQLELQWDEEAKA